MQKEQYTILDHSCKKGFPQQGKLLMKPDSVSKHNVFMTIEDAKKIAAGTHQISGLSGKEGKVTLTPVKDKSGVLNPTATRQTKAALR